jgi:inhibitor of KinA
VTSARFLDAGEAAIVVEYGADVDPAVNDRVLALDAALAELALDGVRETVPTYRSLMIHYDPHVITRAAVIEAVHTVESGPVEPRGPVDLWTIPCCYEPAMAEDLGEVAAMTRLTPERVVELHSSATYRVYMYGFAPGFCYLGGVPKELAVSRRATPRPPHPPNTVLLGGGLTLVATFAMPTGWWIMGRTPERMFAVERKPVFLVGIGDALRFESVDMPTYVALEARAASGETVARRERAR